MVYKLGMPSPWYRMGLYTNARGKVLTMPEHGSPACKIGVMMASHYLWVRVHVVAGNG